MVKNLPLLMAILLIGVSSSLISGSINLSGSIEWIFFIISLIANITAVIGLSLHVFLYLPMKKAEKNLKETFSLNEYKQKKQISYEKSASFVSLY